MRDRLPTGKVPWDLVARHVAGALPPEVRLGPALGEDAALVELGGGELWAVAADPISFTTADAGRLAVIVNANDVAVRGARPRFFLAVVLVAPGEASTARIEELLAQIQSTCQQLGVTLLGGHTEVTPGLSHSLVIGTMLGPVEGSPLTSGGLRPGDRVGVTRWAGVEGSSILLQELGDGLRALHGPEALAELEQDLASDWLLVSPAALAVARVPGVTALHDVTEGGVAEALHELGLASGLCVKVDPSRIPLHPGTALLCQSLGLDPLGLIGSGALLVGCEPEACPGVEEALRPLQVPLQWIGEAAPGDPGATLPRFPRDEILRVLDLEGLQAVIFDLDGTLVSTTYDWQAIREQLGITGTSIIDQLNGLPEPQRTRRWAEMEEIERRATEDGELHDGVRELLELLHSRRVLTALVTNNCATHAQVLLDRFQLEFEVVLTRDDGQWKPSGAPLQEAMRRLRVEPALTLAVGDSRFDLLAGREAGCGHVCLLYEGARHHRMEADLAFPDVAGLHRYLQLTIPPLRDGP